MSSKDRPPPDGPTRIDRPAVVPSAAIDDEDSSVAETEIFAGHVADKGKPDYATAVQAARAAKAAAAAPKVPATAPKATAAAAPKIVSSAAGPPTVRESPTGARRPQDAPPPSARRPAIAPGSLDVP